MSKSKSLRSCNRFRRPCEYLLPFRNGEYMKTSWIVFIGSLLLGFSPAHADEAVRPIRVGLTATYLHDQYPLHEDWRRYMERKLERPVVFVRRDSYDEMMDLLRQNKLEFAWICDTRFSPTRTPTRIRAI